MALHKRKLSENSSELLEETNEKKSKNYEEQIEDVKDNSTQSQNLNATKKPICKYGADCYRKNSVHLEQFEHPATSN
jgi:hypothetical protein